VVDEPEMEAQRQHYDAAQDISRYLKDFTSDRAYQQGRKNLISQFTTNGAPNEVDGRRNC